MRSSRVNSRAAWGLALTMVAVGSAAISAHRTDEYLQAARLAITPDGVHIELDLTPGIALADAIISDIDRDRDGILSSSEQAAYGRLVLGALDVEADGQPIPLEPGASNFPGTDAIRRGEGTIRLQSAATLSRLSPGPHQLWFRNRHHRTDSVYLANTLIPDNDQVAVTAQRRDGDQTELTIDYVVRPAPAVAFTRVWALGGIAAAAVLLALWTRPSRSVR
ncbi:MAG: hypothetical protein ABJC89_07135 [Acidobacteriota bacterium]